MSSPNPDRRNERARQAILRAALDLSRERGFPKTTIEGIAARAGVGKQTIYRWWPSKAAVILDALNEYAGGSSEFPDTGDIVADLTAQMNEVAELLSGDEFSPFSRGVLPAAQNDPEIAQALLETIVQPRIDACKTRLERAQEQGQLRTDVDLDDVVELLYGPLYHRLVLHTRPISKTQVASAVGLAFEGLAPTR